MDYVNQIWKIVNWKDVERRYLKMALDLTEGRKTQAAKVLGVSFRSFRYRLAKYNMDED